MPGRLQGTLPEASGLFVEYALAAARNKQQDYTKKLQNVRLLILDEFLLVPVKPPQQESLLELLERRSGNTSTITAHSIPLPDGMSSLVAAR